MRDVLADANTCLGGGACTVNLSDLDSVIANLNAAFPNGEVSTFADDFLTAPGGTSGGSGGMTPTPDPSSALLFGIGLLTFGIFNYKRRSAAGSRRAL